MADSFRCELVLQLIEMPGFGHDGGLDGALVVAVHDAQSAEYGKAAGESEGLVLLLRGDAGTRSTLKRGWYPSSARRAGVPPLILRRSIMAVPRAMSSGY